MQITLHCGMQMDLRRPHPAGRWAHTCGCDDPLPYHLIMFCSGSDLKQGWNESFWNGIGLGDLVDEGFQRIGTQILPPGVPVGSGLEEGVAKELGLVAGTPVATGIIDAHAGGLGMFYSGSNLV